MKSEKELRTIRKDLESRTGICYYYCPYCDMMIDRNYYDMITGQCYKHLSKNRKF